jgi:hypothetical protein
VSNSIDDFAKSVDLDSLFLSLAAAFWGGLLVWFIAWVFGNSAQIIGDKRRGK